MTTPSDRPIVIRLSAHEAERANLLEGLDTWLRLGLLSDAQVRQICAERLVCAVPTPITAAPVSEPVTSAASSDFADAIAAPSPAPARPVTAQRPIEHLLNRFMAEISVIWLLFLGVFLVVVSSGVLAASQWQNFSPTGQYGILFTYTLAFFAVGLWANRRLNLRLTAQMLQVATLLIIPVNFWMMDQLRLWQTAIGLVFQGIAALSLTAITVLLLRPNSRLLRSTSNRLLAILNCIGLSWLHWGWSLANLPLVATYIGTIGTAFLLFWQSRQELRAEVSRELRAGTSQGNEIEGPNSSALPPTSTFFAPATIVICLSALLLIGRALLLANIPFEQLGLAFGVCGWLWIWLTRSTSQVPQRDQALSLWTGIGTVLMLLGWTVSVAANPPWQALFVSGLGIWLLLDHLWRLQQPGTLIALFLVGLQAYTLVWRVFPVSWQTAILATATQWFGQTSLPIALLGLAGIPYLWFTLAIATRLHQSSDARSQAESSDASRTIHSLPLYQQTELLALIFGVILTSLSLFNPGLRSLNLLFSALTLAWVLRQRSQVPTALIYLTHLVALGTILSGIDWFQPDLPEGIWAAILLGIMVLEWGLCLWGNQPQWQQSAWHIGLGLAGCSYVLLWPPLFGNSYRNLVWLIAPASLSGLAWLRRSPYTLVAAWVSTAALIAQLLLLSTLNTWIISLTVAVGLMLVNTYLLHHLIAAVLAVGFVLGLEAVLVWRQFSDYPTSDIFLLISAITLLGLWLLRAWLTQQLTTLRRLYAKAVDGWGNGICLLLLLLLTLVSTLAYVYTDTTWQILLATATIILAIAVRLWQQRTDLGFYGLAWSIEIGAVLTVAQLSGNLHWLTIATLALGLLSQLIADAWVRKTRQSYRTSWHTIPLLYAGLGLMLAHSDFTAFTGLYTLAAALIAIGVGRRYSSLKLFTQFGVLLASLAAYELLVYRLLQVEGGYPGDGITLLAGLAALIAWGDRLLQRWLLPYLHFTLEELQATAHLHWALGSGLAIVAVLYPLSATGTVILIATAITLSGYALLLGRSANETALNQSTAFWTYAGIIELLATLSYGFYEAVPDRLLLLAWAGAIACTISFIMQALPWQNWGWSHQPWQNSALVFPGVILLLTAETTALQSLLLAAAFYAWFAKSIQQVRLSYVSVFLLDWAIGRFAIEQGWFNTLWFSTLLGGTLLYVAQFDPDLRQQSAREQRHGLRSLATGLICLTALYQAELETGRMAIGIGVFTVALSLGLMFAGLLLRIRAFLYVGTLTFILRVLRWLWLFVNSYSLLLWAIGIVLGLIFIWIAATFEARRSQVNTFVQYWSAELDSWD
ncbi:MAG: hypothetical protein Kow00121_23800 [Elainellaceae cyanobacterium]